MSHIPQNENENGITIGNGATIPIDRVIVSIIFSKTSQHSLNNEYAMLKDSNNLMQGFLFCSMLMCDVRALDHPLAVRERERERGLYRSQLLATTAAYFVAHLPMYTLYSIQWFTVLL